MYSVNHLISGVDVTETIENFLEYANDDNSIEEAICYMADEASEDLEDDDLFDWSKENADAIDEIVNDGILDTHVRDFSFIVFLRSAYYWKYKENIENELQNCIRFAVWKYLTEEREITEIPVTAFHEIQECITEVDICMNLQSVYQEILEILGIEDGNE